MADSLNLALIKLNEDVPLRDIIIELQQEIQLKQSSIIQRYENTQKQFLDAILKGDSLEEFAKLINKNLDNPVFIKL